MISLAVLAITFLEVSAWKYVEGRGEWIPAFRATVSNSSGIDWSEARLRVRSRCADGETAYEVKARNLLVGRQTVEVVLYDGPVRAAACDGPVEVEWLEGIAIPEDQRPAFILLGFRLEDAGGNVNTHLEGIIEHRRRSDVDLETERLYWSDGGEKIHLEQPRDFEVYCFRVRPGEMGIAGFLLSRDAQSEGPLTRFLRFFDLQPGKESWLGVFSVNLGPGRLVSLTIDPQPAMPARLAVRRQRPVVAVEARRSRTSSILTVAK
jgi:hypothetical protein